jgi:hypothetical protein
MNVRIIAVLIATLAVLSASVAFAKRSAPGVIKPIRAGEIEFRVPHSQAGFIEAWDVKRDELVWRRQIYVVKYTIGLERDVQEVFIQSVELKDNTLLVKNERKSEYELDVDSLEVKVIKGALVENRK